MSSTAIPDHPLPAIPGYILRRIGPILGICPERWRSGDDFSSEQMEHWHSVIDAVQRLRIPAVILDMNAVQFLPAFRTGWIMLLLKTLDGVKQRGRLALVGVDPAVREYFRVTCLEPLFEFHATEAEAAVRIGIVLAESPPLLCVSRITEPFSFAVCNDVCIVTVSAGLFDGMDEVDAAGPTYRKLREDFLNGLPAPPRSVVLDLRAAGQFNHRTLNAVVQLCQAVTKFGGKTVVCGQADAITLWSVCKFDKIVAPYATTLSDAMEQLRL